MITVIMRIIATLTSRYKKKKKEKEKGMNDLHERQKDTVQEDRCRFFMFVLLMIYLI